MDRPSDADLAAYTAARDGAAVASADRDVLVVSGPDALDYLQGQVTQEVADMQVGESRWSFVLQPQGKVEAFFRMTRTGPTELVVDVDGGWGDVLRASLERFKLRTKLEVEPLGWRVLSVRGPDAASAVAAARGHELAVPAPDVGLAGTDLMGPDPVVDDVPVLGPAAWEALRIESGLPRMGAELDESTIPNETGLLEVAVSFTKGCYRGQELVERIHSRGGRRQQLMGVVAEAEGELAAGDELRLTAEDKAVGRVTSAAWSPLLGASVGLAYVRSVLEPGHEVVVGSSDTRAVVRELPLVGGAT